MLYGRTRADVAGKLTAALRGVQQGRPVPGQRLGHGSAAMTRHYQHVLPAMLADAGSRLARFLAAAGS